MNKKVSAIFQQEVSIPFHEEKRIALEFIYDRFNWGYDYSIEDNKVYEIAVKHIPDPVYYQELIREATEFDYSIEKIVNSIKETKSH